MFHVRNLSVSRYRKFHESLSHHPNPLVQLPSPQQITGKMKELIIFGLCLVVTPALSSPDWEEFKKTYGKSYKLHMDTWRMNIYLENTRIISEHNEKYNNGEVSYKLKVNQFTDMKVEEFKEIMNGYRGGIIKTGKPYVNTGKAAADTVDWRNKGLVTPVKNQGQCGSCWAFSTTGTVEGQHARKTGNLDSLSEQNLVDCSGNFGNEGCNGGLMNQAFEYIKANTGIDTEPSYPYTAKDGTCSYNNKNVGATMKGHVDIPQGDENALKNAVSEIGPVSAAIDASHLSFQLYSEGVYNEPACSSTELDHGVLVVGYGTENGQDYWLVKNSWGITWGEEGYIKMSRNANNQCGIATQASYPIV